MLGLSVRKQILCFEKERRKNCNSEKENRWCNL